MSKHLTPLEAFNNILKMSMGLYKEDIEAVKNALKDSEMEHTLRVRLENINYKLVREKQANEKKLKAFEIINEIFNFEVVKDGNTYLLRACCSASFINEENYKKIKRGLK